VATTLGSILPSKLNAAGNTTSNPNRNVREVHRTTRLKLRKLRNILLLCR
jgi:hypothetical protein